jgi:hypothetical protein
MNNGSAQKTAGRKQKIKKLSKLCGDMNVTTTVSAVPMALQPCYPHSGQRYPEKQSASHSCLRINPALAARLNQTT